MNTSGSRLRSTAAIPPTNCAINKQAFLRQNIEAYVIMMVTK
jgi:hypothetical protein